MTLKLRSPGTAEGTPSLSSNQLSILRIVIPVATMTNHRKRELTLTSTSHTMVNKERRQVSLTRFRYCAEMTPANPQSRSMATSDVYANCACIIRSPCCKGKIIVKITYYSLSLLGINQGCLSYRTPLHLPILDSFPHGMYSKSSSGAGLSVLAALTASTRTADKIRAIEGTAARMLSVDERENLVNGLGEIRESYETGWGSGSEDEDD